MRKKINNKVVSIVVALALVCGVVMSAFAANDYVNPTFTDVPKSHWGYTFVEKAVEKGWVTGMGGWDVCPGQERDLFPVLRHAGQGVLQRRV